MGAELGLTVCAVRDGPGPDAAAADGPSAPAHGHTLPSAPLLWRWTAGRRLSGPGSQSMTPCMVWPGRKCGRSRTVTPQSPCYTWENFLRGTGGQGDL